MTLPERKHMSVGHPTGGVKLHTGVVVGGSPLPAAEELHVAAVKERVARWSPAVSTAREARGGARALTHAVAVVELVVRGLGAHAAVDGPAGARVAQHAGVVDERLVVRVRGLVQLDERALHVLQVPLERVEEAPRLEVLRRCAAMWGYLQRRKGAGCVYITYTDSPSSLIMYPMP